MVKGLVSICTQCYNHSEYIEDYFLSIVNQTYQNIELVIVDDCSTDNSVELIEKFINKYSQRFTNVVLVKHSINKGITSTCNDSIIAAKGDYIFMLSSDDMLLPNGIQILVDSMEQNSSFLLGIANANVVQNEYRYFDAYKNEPVMNIDDIRAISNIHEKLFEGNFICQVGAIYRREVFDICGLYDTNMIYEDKDFLLTYTNKYPILFINDVVALYRHSRTSVEGRVGSKEEKEKGFMFVVRGSLMALEKHEHELPERKGAYYIRRSLITNYYTAKSRKYKNAARELEKYMTNKGIHITLRERIKYTIVYSFPNVTAFLVNIKSLLIKSQG